MKTTQEDSESDTGYLSNEQFISSKHNTVFAEYLVVCNPIHTSLLN